MSRVRSKRAVASVAIATGELVSNRFPPEDISFLLLITKLKANSPLSVRLQCTGADWLLGAYQRYRISPYATSTGSTQADVEAPWG